MKGCEWCEKEFLTNNYARHLGKCIFKNELELKKSDFLLLRSKKVREDPLLEVVLMELKKFLTESIFEDIQSLSKINSGRWSGSS